VVVDTLSTLRVAPLVTPREAHDVLTRAQTDVETTLREMHICILDKILTFNSAVRGR
jgi:hypothetical protein